MNKLYIAGLLAFGLLGSNFSNAQINQRLTGIAQEYSFTKDKRVDFVRLKDNNTIYESNAEGFLNSMVLDADIKAKKWKSETDHLGMTHTKYQLFYNDIIINGSIIIVHSQNGKVRSINGDLNSIQKPANKVVINTDKALELALKKVNAKKYKWENKDEEKYLREAFNDPNFTFYPKGELVLYTKENYAKQTSKVYYAFKFNIAADEPLYRANVIVDAQTGEIINEENLICHADVSSTANTKYSGVQTFTTDNYAAGQYRLRETGRGLGIETYNLNNTTTYTNTDFTYTSNIWPNTAPIQTGEDAHWGAEKTYDYYMVNHGRNSIDNAGYKLLSYVHYSTNYNNAFWNGSYMTYGDGNGTLFTILTALDVCGHEITHGLTNFTAGLGGTGSGEPGQLNEGFSDIFGTTIENFARPGNWDWKIGADITPSGNGIRNMSNPKLLGQPNCYMGINWDPTGEVHNDNGPCIYWYYLLCQGGTGVNDNANSYTVTPLGMSTAARIAFRALTVYFVPTTNYASARNYAIQAAIDLYGNCSNEVVQTTNAWYAVGVGPAYSSTLTSNFAANATSFCSVPANINFNNTTVGGLTYQWTFGDGTAISTATNPAHTYTANGTYTVKLKTQGCLGAVDSIIKTTYITVATPANPTTTGASRCGSGSVNLTAAGTSQLYWYATPTPTGVPLNIGTTYGTPTLATNTTYYVVNTSTNAPVFGAPTNTTIGAGANYNTATAYDIFDVIQPCTLKTAVVYASVAGNRTVELRNAANTILTSTIVNLAVGANTININFALTPGTGYRLGLNAASAVNLYRNSAGAVYPYNIGGLVSITGTSAGTPGYFYFYYNWQLQKADCQSAPIAVTATINAAPSLTVNAPSICTGQSVNLIGSGAATYTWNTGATTSSINVSPVATTVYTLTGSNGGACVSTSTTAVTVNTTPTVAVNTSTICSGQTANLTASGAATYTWNTGATTASIAVAPASTTVYTITGANGVCTNAKTTTVTVNATPTVAVNSSTICSGQNTNLTASGATTYSWNTGATTSSINVSPVSTTVYSITGTNGTCTDTKTSTVTVNATPTVAVNSSTICNGQSTNLSAGGATTYSWNTGAVTASISVSPVSNTTYTVYGYNGTCSSSALSNVVVNALPSVSVAATSTQACVTDGLVTLTGSPAGGIYSGTGVTGSTFNPATGVGAYVCSYSYTNANGCSNSGNVNINVSICTGVQQIPTVQPTLNIYPNPTEEFFVVYNTLFTEALTVRVFDAQGKIIIEKTLVVYDEKVDVSKLAKGIYFVELLNNEKRVYKTNIVKQ